MMAGPHDPGGELWQGLKVSRVSDRDAKAEALDDIIAFLWPERVTPPPEDHGWWQPGDGPYEWSSDTLQVISDLLDARGLIPKD